MVVADGTLRRAQAKPNRAARGLGRPRPHAGRCRWRRRARVGARPRARHPSVWRPVSPRQVAPGMNRSTHREVAAFRARGSASRARAWRTACGLSGSGHYSGDLVPVPRPLLAPHEGPPDRLDVGPARDLRALPAHHDLRDRTQAHGERVRDLAVAAAKHPLQSKDPRMMAGCEHAQAGHLAPGHSSRDAPPCR